ncbi:type II toxin-antitoxin system Phd/YefM family antitoxin [Demequina sp.]|uniref:type II toxin-antitoxin system Phd/YefM family antitoxin n=1 Tax=Demequina sp. TaxID=2050685 RepID=UPI003D1368D2
MAESISVGKLRQNPTAMLRAVQAGATYTVTDHGQPIAEIVSVQRFRWVPSEELNALLGELGSEPGWHDDLDDLRRAEDPADPWGAPA